MIIVRLRPAHRVELKLEVDTSLSDSHDESIDELDTVLATLVAGLPAKLGRRDPRVTGKAIHTARLPIARVAGVDDHGAVQIAAEPERGREPRRASADYRYVIRFIHARSEGRTGAKTARALVTGCWYGLQVIRTPAMLISS